MNYSGVYFVTSGLSERQVMFGLLQFIESFPVNNMWSYYCKQYYEYCSYLDIFFITVNEVLSRRRPT